MLVRAPDRAASENVRERSGDPAIMAVIVAVPTQRPTGKGDEMRSSTTQDGNRSRLIVAGATILMLGAGSYWLWATPVEDNPTGAAGFAVRRVASASPTVDHPERPLRGERPLARPVTMRRPSRKTTRQNTPGRRTPLGREVTHRTAVLAPAG